MIVFDLKCDKSHVFEAWFADSATYESQLDAGEIACPICGSATISKAPMAPNVAVAKRGRDPVPAPQPAGPPDAAASDNVPADFKEAMTALRKMRDVVEKHFDHVGKQFPEEARKIHYGEVERRNIYGDATREEAEALKDEGIEVGEIPWVSRHDA